MLCVAAACADRRSTIILGQELGSKASASFVVLGMARGFGEEHIVLAEQKAALEKEESTYGTGELCGITEKESWTVLLLKNVQTEEGKLRFCRCTRNGQSTGSVMWCGYGANLHSFSRPPIPESLTHAAYYRGQKLIWRVFALAVRKIENGEQMEPKFSGSIAGVPGKAVGQMQEWGAWTKLRRISYVLPNGILRLHVGGGPPETPCGEEDGSILRPCFWAIKLVCRRKSANCIRKTGLRICWR